MYEKTRINPACYVPYDYMKEPPPNIEVFQNTDEEGNINVHFLSIANVGSCVTIRALVLLESLKTYMVSGVNDTIEQLTTYLDSLRKIGFGEKEGREKLSSHDVQVDRISEWKLCKLYTNRIYTPDKNPAETPLSVLYLKPGLTLPENLFNTIYDTYKVNHLVQTIYITRLELIDYLSEKGIKKPLLIDSSCGDSFRFKDRRDANQIAKFCKGNDEKIAGKRKSRRRKRSKRK